MHKCGHVLQISYTFSLPSPMYLKFLNIIRCSKVCMIVHVAMCMGYSCVAKSAGVHAGRGKGLGPRIIWLCPIYFTDIPSHLVGNNSRGYMYLFRESGVSNYPAQLKSDLWQLFDVCRLNDSPGGSGYFRTLKRTTYE